MSLGASPVITEWNICSHRATPVVNKHLLPIYLSSTGEGDSVGLGHFLAMLGPQHLGKLHKVSAIVWEVELLPVTAAGSEKRPEASGKAIKAWPRPLCRAECQAFGVEKMPVPC